MSETAICRDSLSKFCAGAGLDLGCGDDLIVPWAIGIDRRQLGKTSIVGDVKDPSVWFQMHAMDFVFSSHCLEDFEDTRDVLYEWLHVLKPGGYLVLFLPDQKVYEAHCKINNVQPNQDHKHPDFSLDYMLRLLWDMGITGDAIVHKAFPVGIYSFELVIKKP